MKAGGFRLGQGLSVAGLALAASPAHAQFVLVPAADLPPVYAGSVAWGDYDKDGRLDFVLAGSLQVSLWHNTGAGFSNVTAAVAPGMPGLHESAAGWGDFDNDGRLDLLLTGLTNVTSAGISQLWRNTGGSFTNVPILGLPGVQAGAVAWSDFDSDGKLDFLITGSSNGPAGGLMSQLWRNTGGQFTNVPIPNLPGVWLGSVAWGDYDNDGRSDFLLTGHTNGTTAGRVTQLWRNTGTGFTNIPVPGLRGVSGSSVGWADYNNDGRPDFLVQGLADNGLVLELWQNTGTGFTNVPLPGLPGIADGSLAWGDFDNDGRPDFLSTGLPQGGLEISQLGRNTGSGFMEVPGSGLPGYFNSSLAWGDSDNDGRLDLLVAGISGNDIVSQLWQNTTALANSAPAPPAGLSAAASNDAVTLTWSAPADDRTPASGLTYNLRVGTVPGGGDMVSAPALAEGRLLLPQLGSARNGFAVLYQLSPGQTYYWSVQAVDSAFAGSAFAAEQQFSIGPRLVHPAGGSDGGFEIDFTAAPGETFRLLATTNLTADPTNWVVLDTATEISGGRYRVVDTHTTDDPSRFYRVVLRGE